MGYRLIDNDVQAGAQTRFHTHADGSFTVEEVQDCQEVLNIVRRERNRLDERVRYGENMRLVGRIPMVIMDQLRKEGRSDKEILKWLDDPQLGRGFRVWPRDLILKPQTGGA